MTAKTTAGDDSLAKMSCLGVATNPITIVAVPGQIKGLKLEARGIHGSGTDIANAMNTTVAELVFGPAILANALTADNGVLTITPIIEGAKCAYRITQLVNGGQLPFSGPRIHMPGVSDKQPIQVYSADSTNVQVTIEAKDVEKILGGCEGSITKTIVVRDDPKLPRVVM